MRAPDGRRVPALVSYIHTDGGAHRVERCPFPKAAVREAVVNAVAHKDYASGSPVQIRVYDDRLLIGNTCILPQGWTVDDLLGFHTSEPHNPKVANVFFLTGLVESWGSGVEKILTERKFDGIDEPTYRVSDGSLLIEFTTPEDCVARTGGRLSESIDQPNQ